MFINIRVKVFINQGDMISFSCTIIVELHIIITYIDNAGLSGDVFGDHRLGTSFNSCMSEYQLYFIVFPQFIRTKPFLRFAWLLCLTLPHAPLSTSGFKNNLSETFASFARDSTKLTLLIFENQKRILRKTGFFQFFVSFFNLPLSIFLSVCEKTPFFDCLRSFSASTQGVGITTLRRHHHHFSYFHQRHCSFHSYQYRDHHFYHHCLFHPH